MIRAPKVLINGYTINPSSKGYLTAPTVVAPLSITWGRTTLIGHTSPATATINIDFSPTISIGNYAPLGAKVLITDPDGTPYFVGTIRAIEVTAPTTPSAAAHAKITATDWITSLTGARINVLPGASYEAILPAHGGGQWMSAGQESAHDRVKRFLEAIHKGATLDMPNGYYSPDASNLFFAPMRELGHKYPNQFSGNAWQNITRTLSGAAATIHHTPTSTSENSWTVVPWGEGVPTWFGTLSARLLTGTMSATTSINARTDLIEATYWHIKNGSAERYDPKPFYRSKTLRSNPQTSMRLETDTSTYQQVAGGARTDYTHIDRLITRVQTILNGNTWNLSNFIPRITQGQDGSPTDTLTRQLLTPDTRCRISLTLTDLPAWLGLPRFTRINPLGGTNRWDGRQWTIELNCARQTF